MGDGGGNGGLVEEGGHAPAMLKTQSVPAQ